MLTLLLAAALAADPIGAPTDVSGLTAHVLAQGYARASDEPMPPWAAFGGFTAVNGRCVRVSRTPVGQLEAQVCPANRSPCGATFELDGGVAAIPCRGVGPAGPIWVLASTADDRAVFQPAYRASVVAPADERERVCTPESLRALAGAEPPTSVSLDRGARTCPSGPTEVRVTPLRAGLVGGVIAITSAPGGRPAPPEGPPVDCGEPCPPSPEPIHAPGAFVPTTGPAAALYRTREACEADPAGGELVFLREAVCEDPDA
jgi:hypothetical protein